jgi:hypothetical protein
MEIQERGEDGAEDIYGGSRPETREKFVSFQILKDIEALRELYQEHLSAKVILCQEKDGQLDIELDPVHKKTEAFAALDKENDLSNYQSLIKGVKNILSVNFAFLGIKLSDILPLGKPIEINDLFEQIEKSLKGIDEK